MLTARSQHTKTYQYLLITFYIWLLLEGIFRKWLLNSLATPLFFIKYIIVIGVSLIFVLNKEKINTKIFSYWPWLCFYLLFGVLSIVITTINFSIIVGLIGFIVHFSNILLPFLLVRIIATKEKLLKVFNWLIWISVPLCILGIIQYRLPFENVLNRYVTEAKENDIALVGDSVRITSVFSYISPYGTFLNLVLLIMFFIISAVKNKRKLIFYAGIYMLLAINALMTGSRSLVGICFLETAALIIMFNNFSISRVFRKFSKAFAIGFVAFLILLQLQIGTKALNNFIERVESNNDIEGRVLDTTDPFKYAEVAGPFGYGIGATYQGAFMFSNSTVVIPVYFEEETERILLELGSVGFIITFIIRLVILYFSIQVYRQQKDKFWIRLASIPIIYMIVVILGFFPIVFNWLEGIVYWTMVGLSACIRHISQNEQIAKNYNIPSANPV